MSLSQFMQPRMFIAPLIVAYAKQWELEDPEVLFNIRCFYGATQAMLFGAMIFIRFKIHLEDNQKVIKISKPGQPSLFDPTAPVVNTVEAMTIQQYEHALVLAELKQVRGRPGPPSRRSALASARCRRCRAEGCGSRGGDSCRCVHIVAGSSTASRV